MADQHRDYPIVLAQRMRDANWISPQVLLLGRIECRSPDPLTVLNIGGRYEVGHRALRAARAALTGREQHAIRAYLLRPDEYRDAQDQDGRWYLRAIPPAMREEEEAAFRRLWYVLAEAGALVRPSRP